MPTLQRYKKLYQDRIPSEGQGRKQRYPESALPVFDVIKNENVGRRAVRARILPLPVRSVRPRREQAPSGPSRRAAKAAPAAAPSAPVAARPPRLPRRAAPPPPSGSGPQGRRDADRPPSGPSGEDRAENRAEVGPEVWQSHDAHPDQRDHRDFLSHAGALRAHARRSSAARGQGPRAPFLSASGGRVPSAPLRERPRRTQEGERRREARPAAARGRGRAAAPQSTGEAISGAIGQRLKAAREDASRISRRSSRASSKPAEALPLIDRFIQLVSETPA